MFSLIEDRLSREKKNSPLGVNVEKHQGVGYEDSIMRVKEDVSVQSDLEEQVWVEEQEMCFPAGDVLDTCSWCCEETIT